MRPFYEENGIVIYLGDCRKVTHDQQTVFEMGQKVNVYTEEDRFICIGEIDGIHHAGRPGGEEFYDVKATEPIFARFDRISEMRLTDA